MATATQEPARMRTRTKIALLLMISPTALLFGTAILYALANLALADSDAGAARTVINVFMYVVGVVSVLAWLPGLITGIVLLATKK